MPTNVTRIGRADPKEQARHHARQKKCRRQSEASFLRSTSLSPCFTVILQYVGPSRAERHANADLARLLRDGITHHAVNSDGRENERDARRSEQKHAETLPGDRRLHDMLHRIDVWRPAGPCPPPRWHCAPRWQGSTDRRWSARRAHSRPDPSVADKVKYICIFGSAMKSFCRTSLTTPITSRQGCVRTWSNRSSAVCQWGPGSASNVAPSSR